MTYRSLFFYGAGMMTVAVFGVVSGASSGPTGAQTGILSIPMGGIAVLAVWTGWIIRDLERRLAAAQRAPGQQ